MRVILVVTHRWRHVLIFVRVINLALIYWIYAFMHWNCNANWISNFHFNSFLTWTMFKQILNTFNLLFIFIYLLLRALKRSKRFWIFWVDWLLIHLHMTVCIIRTVFIDLMKILHNLFFNLIILWINICSWSFVKW